MIFPAIDLQEGRSVRLYKGDFAQETVINLSSRPSETIMKQLRLDLAPR